MEENHKMSRLRFKVNTGYIFILPAIILFIVLILYPIIYNINLSFYQWNGASIHKIFIGFENYITLIKDNVIAICLKNSLLYILIELPLNIILAFIFAYLISQIANVYRRISSLIRTIIFLPSIIPPAFIGIIFRRILEGQNGYLNNTLRSIGLGSLAINWIGNYKIAIYTVLLVHVWWLVGYAVVIYLSAMQTIPKEYYESAEIDGANRFRQVIHITIPYLNFTHFTLIILGTITSLTTFPLIYTLTVGGPANSTEFLTTYLYSRAFAFGKAGYSATIALLILVCALIITIIQLRLYRSRMII